MSSILIIYTEDFVSEDRGKFLDNIKGDWYSIVSETLVHVTQLVECCVEGAVVIGSTPVMDAKRGSSSVGRAAVVLILSLPFIGLDEIYFCYR